MTRKDLQDALVKELKENILRDVYGKRPSGEEHPVSVFAQDLPVISEDDDDESMYFPYATVRLGDSDTLVLVTYIFTSFSNLKFKNEPPSSRCKIYVINL